ncbi:flagellar hook-length control protein FliK [Lysobacter arvi]|uniref:Flagellar hook-length control protein FliK n=1 Tax=Lysobacter arvi TaxID=3038776 RepID=A0ABU1CEF0_9GAMM|nr:flagellar hook-length control protein FliK [Lysobacter arvi]MDR0182934.1 flagellar hook-length control protein FliK [Lysobacter arvi]
MQAFDALFGAQRANAARTTTSDASRSSNAQDDAATGGFDRMLQSQGSRGTASRTTEAPARTKQDEAKPRDAQSPRASEQARSSDESKAAETKPKNDTHDTARAESKDDAPRESAGAKGDADATAATADEAATASGEASTTTASATTNDAATPALPEQMLALLNGLAGTNAAPAAATSAPIAEALPPGLLRGDALATATDPRGGNASAPVLPTLPGAQPAAAAPGEGDATTAFAMAMGAAATTDAKTAASSDVGFDTTAIGDTTSTAPLSASTMTQHPLSRAAAAAVQANAPIALDNGFDDGLSSRIAWLADQKIGHAEIRVTPDHLGAIDVRLQLDGNRVNAEFHSAQPEVRHALESSLPRLRDMLGQQGLQLGQADVGQRQAQQQGTPNGQGGSLAGANDRGDAANDGGWTRGPVRASRGLLDEYA